MLKQERDKAEKLRVELAAARREGESRAAILRSASDEAARLKEASARATDELRQALRQEQDKAEKLAGELPGLSLAGNAYRGAGIPDCIRNGEAAAEYLLNQRASA